MIIYVLRIKDEGSDSVTERGGESITGQLYQFLLINAKQNLNTVFYRGTQMGKTTNSFLLIAICFTCYIGGRCTSSLIITN